MIASNFNRTLISLSRNGSIARPFLASQPFQYRSFSYRELITVHDIWPRSASNTVLNICPQGEKMVVERLGKLHAIKESGWFIAIPFIDRIAYIVDMREKAVDIAPQAAITKDNVSVEVSGNVYMLFVDAERAAYGSQNPLYAVRKHAQSSMRAAIGEMELDEILHNRAKLNTIIKSNLQEASNAWGIEIRRYEITEVTPDQQISAAMDKQAAAERNRREKVLQAEGMKKSKTLESEGLKIALVNESEGEKIRITNEAEATKARMVLEAEGEASAIRAKAAAQAEALEVVSAALSRTGGTTAAQLVVAQSYIEMYGKMGQQSNTMIFSERPADGNVLLAQAAAVLNSSLNMTENGQGGRQGGGSGGGGSGGFKLDNTPTAEK